MRRFGWILFALLSACGGAALLNAQNASDAATELRCEEVGRAGPDGGHMHAYHGCLREAGLTE
jgi:hypothetical protein